MFRIATYLSDSSIHGIGVFTPEPVGAGTVVWEFTPGVDWEMTADELERFPEPYRSKLKTFCYLDDRGIYVLCGDNARFMNHADTPNCDDSTEKTVAARDVGAGEELTCDYRSFDRTARENGVDSVLVSVDVGGVTPG